MITKYSNSVVLYDDLFQKATDRLEMLGVCRPGTEDKYGATVDGVKIEISSLEEYFSNLRNLIYGPENAPLNPRDSEDMKKIKEGYVFLKLPVDEPYFNIKANSREIIVPDAFKKNGISVLGDEVSEMLFFSIDRFYDATDLSHMQIGFYWSHSADPDKTIYSTPAFFSVIESDPDTGDDKLVFGWPISSEMTKQAGKITFSVRFYAESPVANGDSDEYSLSYSLSTLPQTVFINNGMTYDIKNIDVDNRLEQILDYRVVNSPINGRLDPPSMPELTFSATLLGATAQQKKEFTEQIVGHRNLVALGYRKGPGTLTYAWYYMPNDSTVSEQVQEFASPIAEGKGGYVPVTEFIPNIATYFTGGNGNEWKAHTIGSAEEFIQKSEDAQLYVCCSLFTLLEANVKPGVYYALPRNTLYGVHSPVQKDTVPETHRWIVHGPNTPVITSQWENSEMLIEGGKCQLRVTADNTDARTKWQWYRKGPNDAEFIFMESLSGTTGLNTPGTYSVMVSQEGDYKITIINTKNGGEAKAESTQSVRVLGPIEFLELKLVKDGDNLRAEHRALTPYEQISYIWSKDGEKFAETSQDNFVSVQNAYDEQSAYSVVAKVVKGKDLSATFSASLQK